MIDGAVAPGGCTLGGINRGEVARRVREGKVIRVEDRQDTPTPWPPRLLYNSPAWLLLDTAARRLPREAQGASVRGSRTGRRAAVISHRAVIGYVDQVSSSHDELWKGEILPFADPAVPSGAAYLVRSQHRKPPRNPISAPIFVTTHSAPLFFLHRAIFHPQKAKGRRGKKFSLPRLS